MSSARRTLLTATTAGILLGALWFVPSANADTPATTTAAAQPAAAQADPQPAGSGSGVAQMTTATRTAASDTGSQSEPGELADTGSIDTTPYVVGGTLLLTLGAGFVVYSVRRERLEF
ncbi:MULTISPECIES: LPXTG cell wall anchor domain-containing protein [Streptomyces]|uniref:LPXTG cell wall anchor domain-containing protein n=1 Tax=Streptomyces thermoviolaceus subsp. thermoviolaceus TaxID=66860 RepID=A0ABX0YUI7_STRTL|nr:MULTISPECIES: LPXTG cell wall anchor domain-containing protein [Streptomyces]MCM3266572.1 LPXTG cell wall anchor domain-containing protein [Streptomyces thermoviolaceus]NJP15999.1 LPXTG cell wall anchor domain-containing protein [Streptomyces thermoviolaceus subsp. thermoviolaceus]RSR97834.1 LPXTG cell wall anchor domain-containing protein [Streptomyces sp. WAC00469]WTD47712.1 LPXTG cell wall anchor domain-containing protein [Streptomyces thermoviolaceus]